MTLINNSGGVPISWRPPFSGGPPYRDLRPAGETLMDIARSVPDLPEVFFRRGTICINGNPADRDRWHRIRPKPDTPELPIVVTLYLPLQSGGGGSDGGKSTVAIIASIALIAATAVTLGGVLDLVPGLGAITAGSQAALEVVRLPPL